LTAASTATVASADLVPLHLLLEVGAAAVAAAVAAAAAGVATAAATVGLLARLLLNLAVAVGAADLATFPFLAALCGAMVEV
jgi:hypothetical protein